MDIKNECFQNMRDRVSLLYVDFEGQRDIFLKLQFVAHQRS